MKITYWIQDQIDFGRIRLQPQWTNHCSHEPEEFVCAFNADNKWYDLYVYADKTMGQEVCCRYGDEWDEYLSCGKTIWLFNQMKDSPEHRIMTRRILEETGEFIWIPNK